MYPIKTEIFADSLHEKFADHCSRAALTELPSNRNIL